MVDSGFRSRAMNGAEVGWALRYPPGHAPGDPLPLVVSLHARGASHRTAFTALGMGEALDRLVRAGAAPFALATVDGGDHGYWHAREDGTDAGSMVVDEFVPMLASRGLDTTRLALHGWSMGGYGALLLAGRRRLAVRAVAVASPALFTEAGHTPPGAFDGAADYRRNDVYGRPDLLDGVPLRVDCGRSDPFYVASRDFVARIRPAPVTTFGRGGHDAAYWRSVAPAELAFLGRHLAG
jgi:enterochelin esterase-like enzyme